MKQDELLDRFCAYLNEKMDGFPAFLKQRYPQKQVWQKETDFLFRVDRKEKVVYTRCGSFKYRMELRYDLPLRIRFKKIDLVEFLARQGIPQDLLDTIREDEHKKDHYFLFPSLEILDKIRRVLRRPPRPFQAQLAAKVLGAPRVLQKFLQESVDQDPIGRFYGLSDQERRMIRDRLEPATDFQAQKQSWKNYISDLDRVERAVKQRLGPERNYLQNIPQHRQRQKKSD